MRPKPLSEKNFEKETVEDEHEAVYLHELRDGLEAERIIGSWIDFYNEVRPHSALDGPTPAEAYRVRTEVS